MWHSLKNGPRRLKPAHSGLQEEILSPYTYAGILPEMLQGAAEHYMQMQGSTSGEVKIPRLDFRVYQGASDGLWGAELNGDEPVQLDYFDKDESRFRFQLPGDTPDIKIDIGSGSNHLKPSIHTIVIDMEKKSLSMLWRGSVQIESFEEMATIGAPKIDIK